MLAIQMDKQSTQHQGAVKPATVTSPTINIPEGVVKPANVAEWSEHRTPDGRLYFYNSKTMESMWEKPKIVVDWETQVTAQGKPNSATPDQNQLQLVQTTFVATAQAPLGAQSSPPIDKTRPVSSVPVTGTPWCVVWTGEGRSFFYNPSAKTSVWEVPDELQSRKDVYKMLTELPPEVVAAIDSTKLKEMQEQKFAAQLAAVKFIVTPELLAASEEDEEIKEQQDQSEDTQKDSQGNNGSSPTHAIDVDEQNNQGSDKNGVAAIDNEKLAAQQRAIIPLEARVRQFRDMLAEKQVSAYSTWEKELHKIVFDPRYLLLLSKERKEVFDEYIRDTVEEERKVRAAELKKKKEMFRQLLESVDLNPKSSFTAFCQKYAKDERFRAIEKMRDREDAFRRFLEELKGKAKKDSETGSNGKKRSETDKDDLDKPSKKMRRSRSRSRSRSKKKDRTKEYFFEMLRSIDKIDAKTSWSDARRYIDPSDSRYLDVGSSSLREEYFHSYHKLLKKERKRKKKDSKKSKKSKKRKTTSSASEQEDENSPKMTGKNGHAEQSDSNCSDHEENCTKDPEVLEKERRIQESLKMRQKQVQESLSEVLRDREAMVERHRKHEAEDMFNALLSDLVRNSEISWHDAKDQLKKDARWSAVDKLKLSKDDRKRLFKEHSENLYTKAKELFYKMLDECSHLTVKSKWSEIKPEVENDPRCSRFSSSDRVRILFLLFLSIFLIHMFIYFLKRCEKEFEKYMAKRIEQAKDDFLEMLKETKLITFKTFAAIKEDESQLEELHKLLSVCINIWV